MPPLFLIIRIKRLWLALPVFLTPFLLLLILPLWIACDLLRFAVSLFHGEPPSRRAAWTTYFFLLLRLYWSLAGLAISVRSKENVVSIKTF
jgi:hypothetical protein